MSQRSHKNILITGANGFVGQNLCRKILQTTDFNIRRLVRHNAKTSMADSTPRLETVAISDLTHNLNWPEILAGIDCVVHLAARAHHMQDRGYENFDHYYQANVVATTALAKAAQVAHVQKFIFLSSVKVMGEQNQVDRHSNPIYWHEGTEPKPQDAYGQTKLQAEEALMQLAKQGSMRTVILRPPIIYGPGVKANFLKLISLVQRGLPIPVSTKPNKRSFLFVDNLTSAIITCIKNEAPSPIAVYFVADDPARSTAELASEIARAMKRRVVLVPIPQKIFNLAGTLSGKKQFVSRLTGSLAVDTGKFRKDFGWQQPIAFNAGIEETVHASLPNSLNRNSI